LLIYGKMGRGKERKRERGKVTRRSEQIGERDEQERNRGLGRPGERGQLTPLKLGAESRNCIWRFAWWQ